MIGISPNGANNANFAVLPGQPKCLIRKPRQGNKTKESKQKHSLTAPTSVLYTRGSCRDGVNFIINCEPALELSSQ